MSVETELQTLVKKQAGGKAETLTADSKLSDFGFDSIDLVEIAFEIEDRFHVRLPQNSDEMSGATFGDLVQLVERLVAEKAAADAAAPAGAVKSGA